MNYKLILALGLILFYSAIVVSAVDLPEAYEIANESDNYVMLQGTSIIAFPFHYRQQY